LDRAETVVVGRVGKSHGLDGSFVVEDASDAPERFRVGAELVVEGAPAKIVTRRNARGRPVIRLDRRVPRGAALEIPRSSLAPTGNDEYYVFQLVGLEVQEDGGEALGRVVDVSPGVANDVLELDNGLLLPMVEDCVLSIDLDRRTIVVSPGYSSVDPASGSNPADGG
jgi:16S rRNA processing protein RimM